MSTFPHTVESINIHLAVVKESVLVTAGRASQVVLVVKNSPVNTGGRRDVGSIPGSGRPTGEGNGNPI